MEGNTVETIKNNNNNNNKDAHLCGCQGLEVESDRVTVRLHHYKCVQSHRMDRVERVSPCDLWTWVITVESFQIPWW